MTKLEKAKKVIDENFADGCCGIFDSRNWIGDPMTNIYDDDELSIYICYGWAYFEVFGLTDEEFVELRQYYEDKKEKENKK